MLDLNFVNPFILAAVEVLQIQCGVKVEGGKPFLKGREPTPPTPIAGVIGLTSDQFKGAISLKFEEKVYLHVMTNMLGEECTQITNENQDGAAELLNMVYGSAKTQLNAKGYSLQRALPTVVRGSDLQTSVTGATPTIVIPLKADQGFILIEISVDMA